MNEKDVVAKLQTLLDTRFHSDLSEMFHHYAPTGQLDRQDLLRCLDDAGIGGALVLHIVAGKIISKVDADGDGIISEAELREALRTVN